MRQKITKPLPVVEQKGAKPEPGITDENYERILSLIRHMGRTMEGTPMTFSQLSEESLRDVFLASLNAIYEGGATGETFRKRGKADICIEDKQRAAFIAECKIWKGKAEFLKGIDQLFGYLLWRDCRTSIVIFNKHNVRFSDLLSKVPTIVTGHDRYVSEAEVNAENGEWRYLFVAEDPSRKIRVHIFVFNLFVDTESE